MTKKPVLLCIMDGFGWVPETTYGNAISAAKKPNLDKLFAECPYTTIDASGMAVGLPDGQMGNSEVGHTNIGAGRIVYQQLTLITKSILDGTMKENDVLVRNMKKAIDSGKAIHFMGLQGTGGVHSHIDHLFGLLDLAKHLGAKDVYIHAIMDGRDTDPHDGKGFLERVQAKLDELGIGKIATVTGRYYAMDRDSNWDRIEKAYAAFVYGEGEHAENGLAAIEKSYADGVTDEFVVPCVTCEGGRVSEGDTVIRPVSVFTRVSRASPRIRSRSLPSVTRNSRNSTLDGALPRTQVAMCRDSPVSGRRLMATRQSAMIQAIPARELSTILSPTASEWWLPAVSSTCRMPS